MVRKIHARDLLDTNLKFHPLIMQADASDPAQHDTSPCISEESTNTNNSDEKKLGLNEQLRLNVRIQEQILKCRYILIAAAEIISTNQLITNGLPIEYRLMDDFLKNHYARTFEEATQPPNTKNKNRLSTPKRDAALLNFPLNILLFKPEIENSRS